MKTFFKGILGLFVLCLGTCAVFGYMMSPAKETAATPIAAVQPAAPAPAVVSAATKKKVDPERACSSFYVPGVLADDEFHRGISWQPFPDNSGFSCDGVVKLGPSLINGRQSEIGFMAQGDAVDDVESISVDFSVFQPSTRADGLHRFRLALHSAFAAAGVTEPPSLDGNFKAGRPFKEQIGEWAFAFRHYQARPRVKTIESFEGYLTHDSSVDKISIEDPK